MLTQKYLKSILSYDKATGIFTWLWRSDVSAGGNRKTFGKKAGRPHKKGYIEIRILGKCYSAHRLAFLYVKGYIPKEVDHKDTNPGNNKWTNLREATSLQNAYNRNKRKDNTSGHKGVSWHVRFGKWHARITQKTKRISLGYFDDFDEACVAYRKAQKKYHGEFARL